MFSLALLLAISLLNGGHSHNFTYGIAILQYPSYDYDIKFSISVYSRYEEITNFSLEDSTGVLTRGIVRLGDPSQIHASLNIYQSISGEERKGLLLISDKLLDVYLISCPTTRVCFATSVEPVFSDDTKFTAIAYKDGYSTCTLVATADETTVEINTEYSNLYFEDLIKQTFKKYDTYTFSGIKDITGTKIVSDKPIALFCASMCSQIPTAEYDFNRDCSTLFKQIPSTGRLGTTYLVPPISFVLPTAGYLIRIIPMFGNATVQITNGQMTTSYDASGPYLEVPIKNSDGWTLVKCSDICMVAQYNYCDGTLSYFHDKSCGYAYMVIVPDVSNNLSSFTYSAFSPRNYPYEYNLTIVTRDPSYISGISLNVEWKSTQNYKYTVVPLDTNQNLIRAEQGSEFNIFVTGVKRGDALAFSKFNSDTCFIPTRDHLKVFEARSNGSFIHGEHVNFSCENAYPSQEITSVCVDSDIWHPNLPDCTNETLTFMHKVLIITLAAVFFVVVICIIGICSILRKRSNNEFTINYNTAL